MPRPRWSSVEDINAVADWLIGQCSGAVLDELLVELVRRYAIAKGPACEVRHRLAEVRELLPSSPVNLTTEGTRELEQWQADFAARTTPPF